MTYREAFRWQAFNEQEGDQDVPSSGAYDSLHLAELTAMRAEYLELAHWGLAAIEDAGTSFSLDMYHAGWMTPVGRDEGFLGFILLHSRTPGVAPHDGDGNDIVQVFRDWQGNNSDATLT